MITRFLKQLASSDKKPSSLGTMLVVLSVVQILITGGTVAFVAFRNSEAATTQLKDQLRGELAKQVESELTRYFAIPHKINTLNAAAYRRGELDVLGASTGEAPLYEQLKLFPTISFAFCGTQQGGAFFGVLRDSSQSDESFQVSFSSPATDMLRHYYQVDEQGNRGDFIRIRESPEFDSRKRLWYEAAELTQGPAWTDVYFGFTSDLPNITASTPIYDEQGELEAVCATDVILPQEFRLFLRDLDAEGNLDFGDRGRAFVIDRAGKLIADSTDGPLTLVEGEKRRSRSGEESDDPLIKETYQALLKTFNTLDQIQNPEPLTVVWNNNRYLVEVLPFQDEAGLDWLIVVVVPEDGFMQNIIANINRNTQQTVWLCIAALFVSTGMGLLVARSLTEPILQINAASKELAAGNWSKMNRDTIIPLKRHDEIGELAISFNKMAKQLRTTFATLEKQKDAFARFFPPEYLEFLGKNDVTEVMLGEHVSKEMAVLFSDIRGFTTLAESMTPQESFDFINTYLRYVSPEIRHHDGFVVKFLGDGLMAVFPNNADDAVKAGIAKCEKVQAFNALRATQGQPGIAVGIGIHSGHIMVGMIGDQNRLQADALSDCVNLSARLESLTKVYGVPLLVSGDVVQRLQFPKEYNLRLLDHVIVKGRSEAIAIYEVLDANDSSMRDLKLQTHAIFIESIEYYREGEFQQAKQGFEAVVAANPLDKTAKLYIERTTELIQTKPLSDWAGVWTFKQK